jgi:glycosyltransferase involved in cell wall biosynthesis
MILELARRSRHDWTIFTSHYYPEQTYPELRELDIVELSHVSVSRKYSAVSNAAVTILRQKIELEGYDALVVSSEGLGDLITFRNHSVPVVCYCHTPMKVIHDQFTRKRYLEQHRGVAPAFYIFSGLFRMIDKLAWKHYQYVFCNSEEVKNRILSARLTTPEKVEILHPGLDTTVMKPSGRYDEYFLVAGRIKWFKNIELAIDSFREFKKLKPEFKNFKLRIAGRVEPRSEEYFSKLQLLAGGSGDVVFQRNPSDEELLASYRSCYALIFPSLNEDWGMVPLEAMGFGKPVISVNRGGPAESVIEGVTGYLVEPETGAFVDAMARLAGDPDLNRKLGEAGAREVQKYDWGHFVERMDSYLDTLTP